MTPQNTSVFQVMLIFKTVANDWKFQVKTHILPLACDVWENGGKIGPKMWFLLSINSYLFFVLFFSPGFGVHTVKFLMTCFSTVSYLMILLDGWKLILGHILIYFLWNYLGILRVALSMKSLLVLWEFPDESWFFHSIFPGWKHSN